MNRTAELKIAFYCQHVLGIGHFHRSLEICRALAASHRVTIITGGPPVEADFSGLQRLQLPGLQMDRDFQQLIPCDSNGVSVEEIKKQRQTELYRFFEIEQPHIFITELYPFGRKAFRFELDPVLKAIKSGSLSPCFCCSSVRDILVEKKTGRAKFESRVIATLNNYFDLILVHADPEIIRLDTTFSEINAINIPIRYTGFISKISPPPADNATATVDEQIPQDGKLIVASIGGGNVGSDFLRKVVEGFKILSATNEDMHLQLFCGPYCQDADFQSLQKESAAQITVTRFTTRFADWLQTAALSVSMGGYNTCMDLLKSGVPALVYPFAQNREQELRIRLLQKQTGIELLSQNDLDHPQKLASLMQLAAQKTHHKPSIDINGAAATASQIMLAFRSTKS